MPRRRQPGGTAPRPGAGRRPDAGAPPSAAASRDRSRTARAARYSRDRSTYSFDTGPVGVVGERQDVQADLSRRRQPAGTAAQRRRSRAASAGRHAGASRRSGGPPHPRRCCPRAASSLPGMLNWLPLASMSSWIAFWPQVSGWAPASAPVNEMTIRSRLTCSNIADSGRLLGGCQSPGRASRRRRWFAQPVPAPGGSQCRGGKRTAVRLALRRPRGPSRADPPFPGLLQALVKRAQVSMVKVVGNVIIS